MHDAKIKEVEVSILAKKNEDFHMAWCGPKKFPTAEIFLEKSFFTTLLTC